MKYKWKVASEPTGQYRSFQRRGWPTAYYTDGHIAASIVCVDDYHPRDAREGRHALLRVQVADYRHPLAGNTWVWRSMKNLFATLQEAKDAFAKLLVDHPELSPTEVSTEVPLSRPTE